MPRPSDSHLSISSGTIVRTILFLILFYFFYLIRDVILVVLAGIVVASAVEPGTRWFKDRRVPRVPAVLFIYIATAGLFASAFYFLLIPLFSDSTNFLKSLPEYSQSIANSTSTVAVGTQDFIQGFSDSFSLNSIIGETNMILSKLSSGFFGTVNIVFGGLLSFLLIIVISFYLAVQEDGVGKFLKIVTPESYEDYVIDLWKRSKEKIGLWMQGQLLLAVIVGVLSFLGLTLIGLRNALVLSFVAALFEIIPLFGAFLSAVPAVLVAFIDGGVTQALLVSGVFLIIQQFESQLIYPLVVKKVVGVPPIISIIALVIGGKLAGFLGILLSVPLAAIVMEFLNDLEKRKAQRSTLP